jgi:hypothetical protein
MTRRPGDPGPAGPAGAGRWPARGGRCLRPRPYYPRAGAARGASGGYRYLRQPDQQGQGNEENEPLGLRYIHADIAAPGALGDDRFDAATCNFGLSDIDDLDTAITAVSAALLPRGCFVFSILHPCFAGGKDISGSWPADGSYYGEGHWTAGEPKSALRRQVGANHRMLSTYLGTLRCHGLWLDQITEPLPEPDWDQAHDADRKPVFLVARLVKLPPD